MKFKEDQQLYKYHATYLLPKEALVCSLLSICLFNNFFTVRKCEDDSPCPKVRVPKCYISISSIPAIPLPKGEGKNNNKKKDEEDGKPKIRANNDGVIGGRNRTESGLASGLKDHNLCQDRHTQCKVMSRPNTVGTPTAKRRESKEAADGKIGLKEKRGATIVDTRQNTTQKS
ncbi:hypothetical protein NMG60_11031909 [Bertholletia excelsa]